MTARATRAGLACAVLALLLPGLVRAEAPEHVTSDTKDYCFELARQMGASGPMSAEIRALWLDGRSLCERGQVTSGLLRLRMAMMLTHPADRSLRR